MHFPFNLATALSFAIGFICGVVALIFVIRCGSSEVGPRW